MIAGSPIGAVTSNSVAVPATIVVGVTATVPMVGAPESAPANTPPSTPANISLAPISSTWSAFYFPCPGWLAAWLLAASVTSTVTGTARGLFVASFEYT